MVGGCTWFYFRHRSTDWAMGWLAEMTRIACLGWVKATSQLLQKYGDRKTKEHIVWYLLSKCVKFTSGKKYLMLLGSSETWVYVAWYHEKKYPCYPGWLCFPGGIMPVPVVSSGHWTHSVPWKITMFQGGTSNAVKIFHICWLTFTSWWPRFLWIPHGQVWRPTKMP